MRSDAEAPLLIRALCALIGMALRPFVRAEAPRQTKRRVRTGRRPPAVMVISPASGAELIPVGGRSPPDRSWASLGTPRPPINFLTPTGQTRHWLMPGDRRSRMPISGCPVRKGSGFPDRILLLE